MGAYLGVTEKGVVRYTEAYVEGPKNYRMKKRKLPKNHKAPLPPAKTNADRMIRVATQGEPLDGRAARRKAKLVVKKEAAAKKERLAVAKPARAKKTRPPSGRFPESVIPPSSKLNERVEKAVARAAKIDKALPVKKKRLPWAPAKMGGMKRKFLFLNPSDESVLMCRYSINNILELPQWAFPFRDSLTATRDRLFYDGLPVALREEKRKAVKDMYFAPGGFSTIQPITDALRDKWANVTKRDVRNVLMTLPTYQRNFQRRRPPKVLGRMALHTPGVLACDMFFPSPKLGWHKVNCLTMMDCWSRFTRCYALDRKSYPLVEKAMALFCQELAALGHLPRRMLCDKGSELRPAYKVMENYRQARDKQAPMVLHSETGTPVNIVEGMNAQIQRRLAVFRTARLSDDVSELLVDVCNTINNQKRPDRGNLTPLQLLALSPAERKLANDATADRVELPEVFGLPPLFVGSTVRALRMTRKEQIQNKTKGFAAKWSKTVYTVSRKVALQKNNDHFRYYLEGSPGFFYRHELLKIPRRIDHEVPRGTVVHRQDIIGEEYDPAEDSEDYTGDD